MAHDRVDVHAGGPATGAALAQVADGGVREASSAVDAATAAGPAWRVLAPRPRSEVLRAPTSSCVRDTTRLAALVMLENGKPEADARAEIVYAAEFFRWYAEEAVRPDGSWGECPRGRQPRDRHPPARRRRGAHHAVELPGGDDHPQGRARPRGRLHGGRQARRGDPADGVRARGAARRGRRARRRRQRRPHHRPRLGRVQPGSSDDRVRAISFTGSTRIGQVLLRQAADRVVVTSMELGGNAPFVVTADADLDAAVAGALIAKFRNGGQACTAANRFLVHESVAADFTARLGAAVERFRVGPARRRRRRHRPR